MPNNRDVSDSDDLLKARRRRRRVSQIQLASTADTSRENEQDLEDGKTVKRGSLQAISEALENELQEESKDSACFQEQQNLDFFSSVPWGLHKFASSKLSPNSPSFCFNASEMEHDLLKQLETCFRENYLTRLPVEKRSAFFDSTPEMLSSSGFVRRYLSIWRANPYTIAFSSISNQRTGVSVVLPVSETTYKAFIEGRISCYEISGKDILAESQFLIFDFLLDYRAFEDQKHSVVNSLPFLGFYQLATLATNPTANDFRLTTFATTPPNVTRMNRAGFQKLPSQTPDSKLPLWELSMKGNYYDGLENASTVAHFVDLKNRFLRRSRAKASLLALQLVARVFKKSAKKAG